MGRSYSFEPMKAQQPMVSAKGSGARLGNDEDKRALSQDAGAVVRTPAGVPVFRQPNAETVLRYQDRAAIREADAELRKRKAAKKRAAAKKAPAARKRPAARKASAGAVKKKATSPRSKKPAKKKTPARPASRAKATAPRGKARPARKK